MKKEIMILIVLCVVMLSATIYLTFGNRYRFSYVNEGYYKGYIFDSKTGKMWDTYYESNRKDLLGQLGIWISETRENITSKKEFNVEEYMRENGLR